MCLAEIDIAILCGGKGSRLASVLGDTPKVLAPIGDSTYLDILIARLKTFGAKRFILSCGHLSDKVKDWQKTHGDDISTVIYTETEQQGSSQAVRNVTFWLKSDPVMVINGDTLTNANLCRFLEIYRRYSLEAAQLWSHRWGRRDQQSAGYYLISQRLLGKLKHPKFELFMSRHCEGLGQVDIWRSAFLDIGTPKTLAQAPEFVEFMNVPDWVPDAIRG